MNQCDISIIVPSYNKVAFSRVKELSKDTHLPVLSTGMHPLFIDADFLPKMFDPAAMDSVSIIGEIGLDYRNKEVDRKKQKHIFRYQLEYARTFRKPVIIHCVAAFGDLIEIINDFSDITMVMHRVSTSEEIGRKLLDRGFFMGFGPDLLKNSHKKSRHLVKITPENRIVLETDAPYTRTSGGAIAMPWDLEEVAREIADIRDSSFEEIVERSFQNAMNFIGDAGS